MHCLSAYKAELDAESSASADSNLSSMKKKMILKLPFQGHDVSLCEKMFSSKNKPKQ